VSRRRAGALAALALLAGCTSAGSPSARSPSDGSVGRGPSTATLKARAALDPCPQVFSSSPGQKGSGRLPDLTLRCLGDGPAVRLAGLSGRPAVVNLWAAWCGPCRKEAPAFQRLHVAAGDRVRVLGVLTEDPDRDALDAAAHLGIHYPSVVDGDGRLLDHSGVRALPVTYFVEASGRAHRYVGPPLSYDALRRLVGQHLGVRV